MSPRALSLAAPPLLLLALAAAPAQAQRPPTAVDGDTLRWGRGGEVVRLAGIDAPERRGRARCPAERALGEAAAARLGGLLRDGAPLALRRQPRGRDRYGRTLADVLDRDGRSLGAVLVAEGLAAPYRGRGPRPDWCQPPAGRPAP